MTDTPMTPEREQKIRALDLLELMSDRAAPVISGHLAALLAEVDRLRARVAELEAAAICSSRMTTSDGISKCVRRPGHRGDHWNAGKCHRWSDEYADTAHVRPTEVTPTCTAPHSPSCACASDEYRFCGASLSRDAFPFTCHRRVAHQGTCSGDLDEDSAA